MCVGSPFIFLILTCRKERERQHKQPANFSFIKNRRSAECFSLLMQVNTHYCFVTILRKPLYILS